MVKLNCVVRDGDVSVLMAWETGVIEKERKRQKTHIGYARPQGPVRVVQRTGVRNLEPVAVALVALEIVVGRAREVDDPRAGMPEARVRRVVGRVSVPVPVGRDAEAHLGAGEDVDRLGARRRVERQPSARDVWVVGPYDGVELPTLVSLRNTRVGKDYAADIAG